jgi:hypothetical protein
VTLNYTERLDVMREGSGGGLALELARFDLLLMGDFFVFLFSFSVSDEQVALFIQGCLLCFVSL